MLPEYIDWIVIPLTAGIVGFLTNAIAIRMLFRPYKPHWYTIGWQGIIPRTRAKLAANVAKVVGEKLVTEQEIAIALKNEELQVALYTAVHTFIAGTPYTSTILQMACDKLSANEQLRGAIDAYAAKVLHKAFTSISNLQCSAISNWAQQACESNAAQSLQAWLQRYAAEEAKAAIDNFVNSGKGLADLSEGIFDTTELAPIITEQLSPMLRSVLSRPIVLDRISGMLITYKDEQLSGHTFKRVAANAFFSDEKIVSLVRNKVPDMANDIATDAALRNDITMLIEQKLHELFHRPLRDYAAEKPESYQIFLQKSSAMFATKVVPDTVVAKIASIAAKYEGMSLREAMSMADIDMATLLPTSVPLSSLLLSGELQAYGQDIVSLGQSQQETLAAAVTDCLLQLAASFVPQALKQLEIATVVEEKINSLEIKDVEDMLFSFMSSHFRWINILGFVIGFIIGLGQVVFIKAR